MTKVINVYMFAKETKGKKEWNLYANQKFNDFKAENVVPEFSRYIDDMKHFHHLYKQ